MIFLIKKEAEELLISDFRKENNYSYTGWQEVDEHLVHAHEVDFPLGTVLAALDTHYFNCIRDQYEFYHYP